VQPRYRLERATAAGKRVRTLLVRGDGLTAVEVGGLSWPDFEKLVADGFRLDGYSVEHVGGRGPEGGIDLRLHCGATLTLVQCKHWKARRVGVVAVCELTGLITQHQADAASTAVAPAVGESVPACPLCGAPTVPRTSRYGPFHGCSRYPMCRGVIDDQRLAV
jgi:hypothetical protein